MSQAPQSQESGHEGPISTPQQLIAAVLAAFVVPVVVIVLLVNYVSSANKDAAGSGKSVCNGPCATNWPPLFAMDSDGSAGDYSVITRDDGKKQWAFKGKPLYFWSKDQKAGDTTGDGFNNVWHVAKP